jgi:glycosyltransferase involved in cell wall biosynthesis
MMMENVTCGIKTLMRPQALRRLLTSIEHFYPGTPSVIVDDSPEPLDWVERDFPHARYIKAEYDLGQGPCRNIMIDAIDTKYTLHLDDDFYFFLQTRLETFYDILENSDVDLIGGTIKEDGRFRYFHGLLQVHKGILTYAQGNRGTNHVNGHGYQLVDIVLNFFMAHTDKLKEIRWADDLKINTHTEFFLRAKDAMKIAFTPHVAAGHCQVKHKAYSQLRGRDERAIALQKHGIRQARYVGKWR